MEGNGLPVKTIPTKTKRHPKTDNAIWQFAATTTPATTMPPSIFSTRSLDMGARQGFLSISTSMDLECETNVNGNTSKKS